MYKHAAAFNERRRERRRLPEFRPSIIKADMATLDARFGWKNDLTVAFIKTLIASGCSYCGQDNVLRLSLDRIDNDMPHNQNNVVVSCVNCNLTRGSMPYAAWLVVAKGMREARRLGLLDGWTRRA